MDAIHDFEDMPALLDRHRVRYLIIGGLAFIDHPRHREDVRILRLVRDRRGDD